MTIEEYKKIKTPKYRNKKVETADGKFDSIKEKNRYDELLLLEKDGIITDIRRQVKFELIPSQYDEYEGKVAERALSYIADFVYIQNGERIVEDCKGYRTETYKIKKKLMLWIFGVKIREV